MAVAPTQPPPPPLYNDWLWLILNYWKRDSNKPRIAKCLLQAYEKYMLCYNLFQTNVYYLAVDQIGWYLKRF